MGGGGYEVRAQWVLEVVVGGRGKLCGGTAEVSVHDELHVDPRLDLEDEDDWLIAATTIEQRDILLQDDLVSRLTQTTRRVEQSSTPNAASLAPSQTIGYKKRKWTCRQSTPYLTAVHEYCGGQPVTALAS